MRLEVFGTEVRGYVMICLLSVCSMMFAPDPSIAGRGGDQPSESWRVRGSGALSGVHSVELDPLRIRTLRFFSPGLLAVEVLAEGDREAAGGVGIPWLQVEAPKSTTMWLDRGRGRWFGLLGAAGRVDLRMGLVVDAPSDLRLVWHFLPLCEGDLVPGRSAKDDPNDDGEETEESDNEIVPQTGGGAGCRITPSPFRDPGTDGSAAVDRTLVAHGLAAADSALAPPIDDSVRLLDAFCRGSHLVWLCPERWSRGEPWNGVLTGGPAGGLTYIAIEVEALSRVELVITADLPVHVAVRDEEGAVLAEAPSVQEARQLDLHLGVGRYLVSLSSSATQPVHFEAVFGMEPLNRVELTDR